MCLVVRKAEFLTCEQERPRSDWFVFVNGFVDALGPGQQFSVMLGCYPLFLG